jgi:hypothetical protein
MRSYRLCEGTSSLNSVRNIRENVPDRALPSILADQATGLDEGYAGVVGVAQLTAHDSHHFERNT